MLIDGLAQGSSRCICVAVTPLGLEGNWSQRAGRHKPMTSGLGFAGANDLGPRANDQREQGVRCVRATARLE